jgi:hypothetical protein
VNSIAHVSALTNRINKRPPRPLRRAPTFCWRTADDVPIDELLALFPEGQYKFFGQTVEEKRLVGTATLTHAVPAEPSNVSARVGPGNTLIISWDAITDSAAGFPDKSINIVGYQVIVAAFQVTVPATITSVTVSPEFVASLAPGDHPFAVLVIEAGRNQTITEGFSLSRNARRLSA